MLVILLQLEPLLMLNRISVLDLTVMYRQTHIVVLLLAELLKHLVLTMWQLVILQNV